jgi:hypothetical protein
MIHSIGYLGPYDENIGRLALYSDEYIKGGKVGGKIDEPSKRVNGIWFGYLQMSKHEFVAVRARYLDVLVNLESPVPIDVERHTDNKGFGPKPSQFGDESATNLLRDMVAVNPSQASELNAIGTKAGLKI